MEAFAGYLLKSSVWLSGFALVYLIFLRNERFFLIKRYYLLAGILTALFFPFISVRYQVELPAPEFSNVTMTAPETAYYPVVQEEGTSVSFDIRRLLLYCYLTGVLILIIRFLWQAGSLLRIIGKSAVYKRNRIKLIRTGGLSSSFSFFNYVFIGSEVSDQELDEIMNHELVHVKQNHWFDLILVELLRVFQWMNPFTWIYSGFIRQNHEYLADESALQKTSDPSVYKAVLANQILGLPVFSISNSFSFSLNKKRFDMMNRIITSPYRKLKILCVLPVFALILYAFAEPDYHYVSLDNDNQAVVLSLPSEEERPEAVINDEQGNRESGESIVQEVIPPVQQEQRPIPVIAVDGVITGKSSAEVRKELGYNMGTLQVLSPEQAIEKYGEKGVNGVVEITTRKKALEMGLNPPFPRLAPDDYPTFQGQRHFEFINWVVTNTKYPEDARSRNVEGWVSVNFRVGLDGTLSDVISTMPTDQVLVDEVVRVIRSSPRWDPPKNKEVDEPFTFGITMRFKLPDQVLTEAPFIVVENMPLYNGGEAELLNFIRNNLRYPEKAREEKIEGRVIVRFIVNTEGGAEGASVLKGVHPLLDAEALRVVSMLTGFKPGTQGGRPVNVWYMVPVTFSLQEERP